MLLAYLYSQLTMLNNLQFRNMCILRGTCHGSLAIAETKSGQLQMECELRQSHTLPLMCFHC